ncbi:MAG TPA: hypothetical protein VFU14_17685 [Acidimicrobiales bacterium]|nr:hypothetical protein [Acidimicrobiales bacterium]
MDAAAPRQSSPPDRTATRVADAHAQARRTLGVAAAFTVASPVAAVVPHDTGAWLPLHLFLVGAVLSAISGATQLLAVTWSTAPAPPPGLAAAQRWAVALGAAGVAAGRELEVEAVTGAGATLVAVGLALLAAILVGVRRTAGTDRFAPAVDTYLAALACGAVGVALGGILGAGEPGEWWARLRGAHVSANAFGLVGLVIAGTLPFFVATQARMKMAPRATPTRVRAHGAALTLAVAVAATGHLLDRPGVAAAGLVGYAAVLALVVTTLPRPRRRQLDWAGPRLLQLGAGIGWWVVTTLLLARSWAAGAPDEAAVLRALAIGGFAQILVASLAYFGPVLRGGGHERLSAGFTTTRSWLGLVVGNVAAGALLAGATRLAGAALGVWAADTAWRTARLLLPPRP